MNLYLYVQLGNQLHIYVVGQIAKDTFSAVKEPGALEVKSIIAEIVSERMTAKIFVQSRDRWKVTSHKECPFNGGTRVIRAIFYS